MAAAQAPQHYSDPSLLGDQRDIVHTLAITIDCNLPFHPWARFRSARAAVEMHFLVPERFWRLHNQFVLNQVRILFGISTIPQFCVTNHLWLEPHIALMAWSMLPFDRFRAEKYKLRSKPPHSVTFDMRLHPT
jgi:hypothetical protein